MFNIPTVAGSIEDPSGVFPQAQVDSVDFDILTLGAANYGVLNESDCEVTAQVVPDMTLAVASGSAMLGGSTTDDIVAVTGDDVTIGAAHTTLARFDLVATDETGTPVVVAGTASATPVFPAIPADRTILAAVYVPAADTAISSAQIVDKRILLPTPRSPSDGTWTVISKPTATARTTSTLAADPDLAFAMAANTAYRIRAKIFITSVSGGLARGFKWRHTGPASPTLVGLRRVVDRRLGGGTTTPGDVETDLAYSASDITDNSSFSTDTEGLFIEIDAVVANGVNAGTWAFQWAGINAADTQTVHQASWLEYGQA